MIRQYYTSPFQGGDNPLRVGTVASGSIFRLPAPVSGRPWRTTPWIVESFLNGKMGAAVRNPVTGFWEDRYIRGRSDLAILRSLASGRRVTMAVRHLEHMDEEGMGEGRYPGLPDVSRFHNRYRNRSLVA
ncbi:hypothetical protein [Acetobacter sicerae]|uniref:hypothetical protein n=1 Tax=Acetobacter sicerae TaxID=85325 RepID=UPI00156B49C5|nr:hypothetical protein [Acetobacter sicerae]NHN93262.1 hypothetical protein [Acetobacter sicerae]